jgi:hypothetical protein
VAEPIQERRLIDAPFGVRHGDAVFVFDTEVTVSLGANCGWSVASRRVVSLSVMSGVASLGVTIVPGRRGFAETIVSLRV